MAQVGENAPAFRLQNEKGEWVELAEVLKFGPVMLVFYPGDFTLICTKQLCAYQDSLDRFQKFGIQIFGVSPNTPESHQQFRERYQFSFHLLSDPQKEVFKSYHVVSFFSFGGTSRAVFFIDRQGKVVYRHVEAMTLLHRRPEELLEVLRDLHEKRVI